MFDNARRRHNIKALYNMQRAADSLIESRNNHVLSRRQYDRIVLAVVRMAHIVHIYIQVYRSRFCDGLCKGFGYSLFEREAKYRYRRNEKRSIYTLYNVVYRRKGISKTSLIQV